MTEELFIFNKPRKCRQYYIDPKVVKSFVEDLISTKAFSIQSIIVKFEGTKEELIIKYTLNTRSIEPAITIKMSLKKFCRISKFKKILND